MMIINSKEQLIAELEKDWKEKKEKSFYYKYVKDSKTRMARELDPDGDMIKNYCQMTPAEKRKQEKKYGKYLILVMAGNAKEKGNIDEASFNEIVNEIKDPEDSIQETENKLLKGMISDFFSNNKKKTADKSPSYIDYVNLLNDFCGGDYRPAKLSEGIDEEYALKCKDVYSRLNNKGDLFMPLYFDCKTGVGLFLIGADHIEKYYDGYNKEYDKRTEVSGNGTFPGIVYPNCIDTDTMTWEMTVVAYDSVEEAVEAYNQMILRGEGISAYTLEYEEIDKSVELNGFEIFRGGEGITEKEKEIIESFHKQEDEKLKKRGQNKKK